MKMLIALAHLALMPGVLAFTSIKPQPSNFTFTDGALRMNHMQVVGTHNSYHQEAHPFQWQLAQAGIVGYYEARKYWYTHSDLDVQLEDQQVRGLELDVYVDKAGGYYAWPTIRSLLMDVFWGEDWKWQVAGFKVFHEADIDVGSNCLAFAECLNIVKKWLDLHPESVPIPILIELKHAKRETQPQLWDTKQLRRLDKKIIEVMGRDKLIVPDDIRIEGKTLEESVLSRGWPDMGSARGRVIFLMDNNLDKSLGADPRAVYLEDDYNLKGRVLFTNSHPGQPSSAFVKINDPILRQDYIQETVKRGYFVRTRAEIGLEAIDRGCNMEQAAHAFKSGAQLVSTDYPAYGMSARWGCDYAVMLEQGKAATCNPVNAPSHCNDTLGLEPYTYFKGDFDLLDESVVDREW